MLLALLVVCAYQSKILHYTVGQLLDHKGFMLSSADDCTGSYTCTKHIRFYVKVQIYMFPYSILLAVDITVLNQPKSKGINLIYFCIGLTQRLPSSDCELTTSLEVC